MTEWEIARNSAIIGGIAGAVVAGILGIFAVWLGTWFNRNAAQKAIDLAFPKTVDLLIKQKLLDSAAELRSEFAVEIRLLRERYHEGIQRTDLKTTHDIVKHALTKHELAWLKFREFLTGDRLKRFDWMWLKYSYQHKTPTEGPFWGYKVPQRWERKLGTIPAENKIRDIAIQRIYIMFKLTEP